MSAVCFEPGILAWVHRPVDEGALEIERQLVLRAQAGDRRAIGELLGRYGPVVYRSVLLPRLGSEAAAKDALSEVYQRVVERLDRFTWQNVGFWPWFRTVALRIALDHLRVRRRTVVWEAEDVARELDAAGTETPVDEKLSEHHDRRVARARVEDALERVHPRYALAIRLRVLEERPREDVARELGVSPATFDVILHRSMQAIRKALGVPAEPKSAVHPPRPARAPNSPPSDERSDV